MRAVLSFRDNSSEGPRGARAGSALGRALAAAMILFSAVAASPALPAERPEAAVSLRLRSYLIVFSRESGNTAEHEFVPAFVESLRGFGVAASIYEESYDGMRFGGREASLVFLRYLRERYEPLRLDAVVAVGTSAANLLDGKEGRFKPGTPLILVDAGKASLDSLSDPKGVFVSLVGKAYEGTFEAMLALCPAASELLVVSSLAGLTREAGVAYFESVRARMLAKKVRPFTLAFRFDPSFEELEGIARSVPPGEAVFYLLSGLKDEDGRQVGAAYGAERFAAACPSPVFTPFATMYGSGAVGGYFPDFGIYGAEAAELAMDAEADPAGGRVMPTGAERPRFDSRALRRFAIGQGKLPKGSAIDFLPSSIWLRHRFTIQVAVVLLLLALAVLATLQVMRRRQLRLLHEANRGLEARVVERTRELEEANAELEASNASMNASLKRIEGMQDALLRSEREAAVGRFASGMSHELNTPLGVMGSAHRSIREALYGEARLVPRLQALSPAGSAALEALEAEVRRQRESGAATEAPADYLERRRGLADRLEAAGVPEPRDSAEILAEAGPGAETALGGLSGAEVRSTLEAFDALRSIEESIDLVDEAEKRAAVVVESLESSVGELGRAAPSPVAIAPALEAALAEQRFPMREIEVARKYSEGATAFADEAALVRVFSHLIRNALQAMGGKGLLGLEIRALGESLAVAISDNGPGIPDGYRHKVFDPFFTTRSSGEGLGLGLPMCKRIVEGLGGGIGFESSAQGATFIVRLVAAKKAG